jgi:lysophospholipase L1-like esterase
MYGYGVSDDQTIPAYYQSISGNRSVNFGVSGYTSRQSLNLLLSLLALGYRAKAIIFYDGINELHSCVKERVFWSTHAEENNIAKRLSNGDSVFAHLWEFALKPIRIIRNMNNPSGRFPSPYMHSKCVAMPAASIVARQLLLNWSAAEAVAASKRIPFFAVLQPTLNTVGSKPRYFSPDPYWKQMNQDVYVQIRALLPVDKHQNLHDIHSRNFTIDGTKWIDSSDVVFIDDGHLGPSGNRFIALRINRLISAHMK